MNYDGKTYRNLEGQVKYLTEVAEALDNRITEVAANIPSKMIVEELPEEGDPNITYYVGPMGTEPNLYYEVWVWVQEEAEGPFVWRELEDTDQVDLSGYLPIQDGVTTNPQAYIKNADGTQGMMEVVKDGYNANSLVRRTGGGQVVCYAPQGNNDAVNLSYANSNFVAKRTDVTTNYYAYCKAADGSQTTLEITGGGGAGKLALYVGNGNLNVGTPTADIQATNKKYVDDNFVGKVSTVTTYRQVYAKNPDGTQYMQVVNGKDFDAGVDRIACFGTDGRLRVGTPVNDKDAATKKYVDDAVGQLIYKHSITLNFTVNSKSFSLDIVVLNGTSTAYTSTDGRQILAFLKGGAYSISTESYAESRFWSVVICPSDKYIHDDTGIGFLLTAGSDGSTIYVDGIDPNYNSNITGVTISDVVTTW